MQVDFCDAGEVVSGRVTVLIGGGTDFVEVDFLEEVEIGVGPFTCVGVAGVEDAGAVGKPRSAAASGGVLNARDAVGQPFAGVGAKEVEGSVLAPIFGQADGDEFSVRRGDVPVHGDLPFRIEFVGIEDDFF